MPQYLSPGVYVEEVKSGSAPIAGVSTSIAGFIGQVADNVTMPPQPGQFQKVVAGEGEETGGEEVNALDEDGNPIPILFPVAEEKEPQLITSWQQFKNNFGDFQEGNNVLAHSVYGFFNNGGSRCWVTRVATASHPAITAALEGFNAIDEITMVAVPGVVSPGIQGAIIDHCENAGDRFAILDGQQVKNATPSALKGDVRNSNYCALYAPWIQSMNFKTGKPEIFPPSGFLAGVYARVDGERGIHKAPANEVIRGAIGVQHRFSKAEQDGVNPAGINLIRQFNGNTTVWGARTLGGDANGEWKYISTRRLFLFLRESIDEGTRWVVFEPNDQGLWAKIRRNISAFLTNVWRAGALFGATPQEAFYVKCDAETNPPEVRELGQVVTEIGVAVVKPAEFVIFRISQWTGPGN